MLPSIWDHQENSLASQQIRRASLAVMICSIIVIPICSAAESQPQFRSYTPSQLPEPPEFFTEYHRALLCYDVSDDIEETHKKWLRGADKSQVLYEKHAEFAYLRAYQKDQGMLSEDKEIRENDFEDSFRIAWLEHYIEILWENEPSWDKQKYTDVHRHLGFARCIRKFGFK